MWPSLLTFSFLLICFYANGQQDTQAAGALEQIIEQQQPDESADLSEIAENLTHLLEHPVNLNRADDEELRSTGLFSEAFIVALRKHIQQHGKLMAAEELQQVEGADLPRVLPYVTVGDISQPNASFGRMVREGKHQVMIRTQVTPETKNGFSENDYPGSPWSVYARYRFSFMKKLSWGFTADKDAGEQFFKDRNKIGFDFYSGHFAVRSIGAINIIALGDYQLEYGQGLAVWTGLSGSKSTDPVLVRKNAMGIRPYTSSNEVFFKRGGAVSLQKKHWRSDIFLSRKKLDANTTSITGEKVFTSFQQSGMHRTDAELEDRNSITELFYGAHIRYANNDFQAGITGANATYSLPLTKGDDPYNQFEFNGRSIYNIGLDYSFNYHNINFFGEIARDIKGQLAYLNGIVISPDSRLAISILHRKYPVAYQAIFSNAFRESGNNFNEQGIYAGFTMRPIRILGISCSYDQFYFPWLRYRTDAPSYGNEFSGTVSITPSRKTEIYIRYRLSNKFINGDNPDALTDCLVPVRREGFRMHISTKVSKTFTLRSRVEMAFVRIENKPEKGLMLFQDLQFHPMSWPVAMNMRFAVFESDSYESRVYAYENDVLYGYSIPAFSDRGARFYLNIRYKLRKGIDLWFRYSVTSYADLESIGTGSEEINGNKKSEFKLQVRFEW